MLKNGGRQFNIPVPERNRKKILRTSNSIYSISRILPRCFFMLFSRRPLNIFKRMLKPYIPSKPKTILLSFISLAVKLHTCWNTENVMDVVNIEIESCLVIAEDEVNEINTQDGNLDTEQKYWTPFCQRNFSFGWHRLL